MGNNLKQKTASNKRQREKVGILLTEQNQGGNRIKQEIKSNKTQPQSKHKIYQKKWRKPQA